MEWKLRFEKKPRTVIYNIYQNNLYHLLYTKSFFIFFFLLIIHKFYFKFQI